jgi:hypothetical protein
LVKMNKAAANNTPGSSDALGMGVLSEIHLSDGVSLGDAFFDTQPCFPCHALFLDSSNALMLKETGRGAGEFTRVGIAKFLRTARQRADNPLPETETIKASIETVTTLSQSGVPMAPWGPITENFVRTTVTIV